MAAVVVVAVAVAGVMLDVVRLLARRSLLASVRRPVVLTFSLVQPMLWMCLFGFLFERSVTLNGVASMNYLTFVAPGIAVMTVLFGASQSGISLVRDEQTGMLGRMAGTATPAMAQLAGKLVGDGLRLAVQASIVLALGVALGAELSFHAAHVVQAAVSIAALILGLASLSCLLATLARTPELMGAYVHIVNMPLLFTSSALLPRRNLPDWLIPVAAANPLSVAAESARALWLGSAPPSVASLCVQSVAALVCFLLASLALARAGRLPPA